MRTQSNFRPSPRDAAERLSSLARDFRELGLGGLVQRIGRAVVHRMDPERRAEIRRWREALRQDREFDRVHSVDTSGDSPLATLGIAPEDIERGNGLYRPVREELFHRAMAAVPVRHDEFTFVDYGSGKGKALLLASTYPFRAVLGVEFSRPLHEASLRNIASFQCDRRACADVRAVCGEATDLAPPETPLVCFFFNPFDRATWAEVLAKLEASWRRAPRPIYIVYVNIRSVREVDGWFDDASFLEVVAEGANHLVLRTRAVGVS